jgi:hypothetical protein
MAEWVLNDELGGMWKEVIVAYFKVLFQHLPEGHFEKTQSE